MNILRKYFNHFSTMAVYSAVKEDFLLQKMWDLSKTLLPDLEDHYATIRISKEEQLRLRLLICAQALFIRRVKDFLKEKGHKVNSWIDIGDSDGSARLLFLKSLSEPEKFRTLGVNLEQEAVDLIRSKGLDALCINAMDINKKGFNFDLVSVFETLEHLPNPVGFLEEIQPVVGKRLIISVPLIVNSRVGLQYLSNKWETRKKPAYSNNHVFELSPFDWEKLFKHTGWSIETQWKFRQFPQNGPLNWIMKYAWRKISFEGFWFVALIKDHTFSAQFSRR